MSSPLNFLIRRYLVELGETDSAEEWSIPYPPSPSSSFSLSDDDYSLLPCISHSLNQMQLLRLRECILTEIEEHMWEDILSKIKRTTQQILLKKQPQLSGECILNETEKIVSELMEHILPEVKRRSQHIASDLFADLQNLKNKYSRLIPAAKRLT